MGKTLFVYLVCANAKEANKIGETVVRKRLAACANLLGECTSIFRWKGKLVKAKEVAVVLKTTPGKYAQLEKQILKMHSYENPAIIALPVASGAAGYLKWVEEEVKP